jgi:hypothetical protein
MTEKVKVANVDGTFNSDFKDICERAEDLGRRIYAVDKEMRMLTTGIKNEYLHVVVALYKDMEQLVDAIIVSDC